ncbi:uncharacterized protein BJX67DRAFT_346857 [Aspergillus lucknowensis]|uniref:Enoyl reductase (ER) domain-containing protein n=1 Tax=Aspergillus lucknowensis TaxID=176173 RepID=A0ABR4M285_9EURO
MKHFSLLRSHIFNSRDDSFAADLMRETGGRGADIVLNSLAGQLLHASWQCVASFGRMIELGKVDFSTNGVLGMAPFAQNRAFFGVDLLRLEEECPDLLKRYLAQAVWSVVYSNCFLVCFTKYSNGTTVESWCLSTLLKSLMQCTPWTEFGICKKGRILGKSSSRYQKIQVTSATLLFPQTSAFPRPRRTYWWEGWAALGGLCRTGWWNMERENWSIYRGLRASQTKIKVS